MTAFAGMTEGVAVALITMTGVMFAAAAPIFLQVRRLHAAVETNHGKRPGEYLEMIPFVLEEQVSMRRTFSEHMVQDEARFTSIDQKLEQMETQAAVNEDARQGDN